MELEKGTKAKDKITGRIGTIFSEEPTKKEIKDKEGKHLHDETTYVLQSERGHKFIVNEENIEEISTLKS